MSYTVGGEYNVWRDGYDRVRIVNMTTSIGDAHKLSVSVTIEWLSTGATMTVGIFMLLYWTGLVKECHQ